MFTASDPTCPKSPPSAHGSLRFVSPPSKALFAPASEAAASSHQESEEGGVAISYNPLCAAIALEQASLNGVENVERAPPLIAEENISPPIFRMVTALPAPLSPAALATEVLASTAASAEALMHHGDSAALAAATASAASVAFITNAPSDKEESAGDSWE